MKTKNKGKKRTGSFKDVKNFPGLGRTKGHEKRNKTLLVEYNSLQNRNVFLDKRIGAKKTSKEHNFEKFLAEQQARHGNKSAYNLTDADDEVLRHRGQSVREIQNFDSDQSDDDLETDKRLNADFVNAAHFGGGLLSEADSRTAVIDNLIAESKKRKADRQQDNRDVADNTELLDKKFKANRHMFVERNSKEEEPERKRDMYDKYLASLHFEPCGTATMPNKKPEDIEMAKQAKLRTLEAEKRERMNPVLEDDSRPKHRSADDLDDGIVYNYDDAPVLKYDSEGKRVRFADEDAEDADEDHSEEDEAAEEEEEEEENEDDYTDIDSAISEEEDEDDTTAVQYKNLGPSKGAAKTLEEVPANIVVPDSYDAFIEFLSPYGPDAQIAIIEKMLRSTDGGGYKQKMENLYTYLLQYINDCAVGATDDKITFISSMVPHLFDLVIVDPEANSSTFQGIITEKFEEYSKTSNKEYPGLDTFVFLHIALVLFPSTDFQHPIITPVKMFLADMLGQISVMKRCHVACGLYVCSLAVDCIVLTKRLVPEAVNFISGVLQMCIPNSRQPVVPPFQKKSRGLLTPAAATELKPQALSVLELISSSPFDDQFRVDALHMSLNLLQQICEPLSKLPSYEVLFAPHLSLLGELSLDLYHSDICTMVKETIALIKKPDVALQPLVQEKERPKPLRQYEPRFEMNFDGRKKFVGSKEKLDRQRLLHRIKSEKRSAIRELRRDGAFIGQQQLKDQLARDAERKRKVQELFGSLSNQEGEYRKFLREKEK